MQHFQEGGLKIIQPVAAGQIDGRLQDIRQGKTPQPFMNVE
jgi:hypothetical protein